MSHDSCVAGFGCASMPVAGVPTAGVLGFYGSAMSGGGQPQWGRPDGDIDPASEGHVVRTGPSVSTEEAVARALHRPVRLAHPVEAHASNLFPVSEV